MKIRPVSILSAGHLATDINQGALPAMLPFFIAAYDLSYAAAASIVFAANITSTIVQPLFGHAADRFSKPWLLSAGLITAGAGLALTGPSPGYGWIVFLAIMSGIGIAAYHPEAARLVNFAAGNRKATAMSIFGIGGTLGFAVGPLVATAAMLQWGLNGTLVLLAPVTLMAVVIASQSPVFEALADNPDPSSERLSAAPAADDWGTFSRLTLTIIGRSVIFYGLNTFIPIYWINALNQSESAGAMALTVFAVAGIAGHLLGGGLADRLGHKKVLLLGLLGLAFFLPVLLLVRDARAATALLAPIGLLLYGTYSPSIVLGQSYLPNRVGFSSGITLGVAVAIGGGAAPIIGKITDTYGIWASLASIAWLPMVICAIAFTLPGGGRLMVRQT